MAFWHNLSYPWYSITSYGMIRTLADTHGIDIKENVVAVVLFPKRDGMLWKKIANNYADSRILDFVFFTLLSFGFHSRNSFFILSLNSDPPTVFLRHFLFFILALCAVQSHGSTSQKCSSSGPSSLPGVLKRKLPNRGALPTWSPSNRTWYLEKGSLNLDACEVVEKVSRKLSKQVMIRVLIQVQAPMITQRSDWHCLTLVLIIARFVLMLRLDEKIELTMQTNRGSPSPGASIG